MAKKKPIRPGSAADKAMEKRLGIKPGSTADRLREAPIGAGSGSAIGTRMAVGKKKGRK